MLNKLKKFIKSSFFRNHHVTPVAPHDVRDSNNDPRELHYTTRNSILINSHIEYGRTAELFSHNQSVNPFIDAVSVAIESHDDNQLKILEDTLSQYYSTVQPKNALEWYGLSGEAAPMLKSIKPWAAPLPWVNQTIEGKKNSVKNWIRLDHQEVNSDISLEDGFTYFGPVSDEKIEVEALRYYNLIQSVCDNGYNRSDDFEGDICGEILINKKGEWRWIAGPGQHRAVVLSALDYQNVPVRALRLVFENEVDIWPNVTSGLYTKKGASKLFHTIFHGNAPHIGQMIKKTV